MKRGLAIIKNPTQNYLRSIHTEFTKVCRLFPYKHDFLLIISKFGLTLTPENQGLGRV